MDRKKDRVSVPVSLPAGLVEEIDELVDSRSFGSRSEVLRYGARLAVMFHMRLHDRAEDIAYDEAIGGIRRGGRNDVS